MRIGQPRLDRARLAQRIGQLVEAAVVRDALAGEQPLDQTHRFLEPVEALAEAGPEIEPERVVLAPEPARADPEDEPAARDVVERRRELCGEARIAKRVRGDQQAQPGAGRQGRERGQRGPALELRVVPVALVGEEVIVEPEAVEARRLGRNGRVPERRPVGSLNPEGSTESHGRIVGTMSLAATAPIPDLHTPVLGWYASNARDLAFRRTTDPWAILVSEVMAQQTQAARAAEAWTRFMAIYPTPAALAAASPADVIRAWRGLGYNRRAIALRAAAITIVDGPRRPRPRRPRGPAAAARDRSVYRPRRGGPRLQPTRRGARHEHPPGARPSSGVDARPQTVAAERALQSTADGLVPTDAPGPWTHALMDIGAAFCRPRDPRCDACPLAASCVFARSPSRAMRTEGIENSVTSGPRKATPPFRSTSRWLRGRILDALRDAPAGSWVDFTEPIGDHELEGVHRQLRLLAAERLLDGHPEFPSRARLATT